MVGGKGEKDLNLTPGVVHDKNRLELDEILARKNAGLLELSPSSAAVEEDSFEEEQAAVKKEDGEESQKLGNLLTGQGDLRVKTETDLLEELEIKTEEQDALSEDNTSEGGGGDPEEVIGDEVDKGGDGALPEVQGELASSTTEEIGDAMISNQRSVKGVVKQKTQVDENLFKTKRDR